MPRHEPERTCIVSRTVRPPAELIRFVLGPENQVVPDLRHKLPGRGVWVTARRAVVEEAVRRRLFARAFKAEVAAPPTRSARRSRRCCARTCGRRSPSPTRPGGWSPASHKVERRHPGKVPRRPHSRRRGGGRRATKARKPVAETPRRRDIRLSGRQRFVERRIGFGIGPVTCDTCCPRRGRRERRLSHALASLPLLSRPRS